MCLMKRTSTSVMIILLLLVFSTMFSHSAIAQNNKQSNNGVDTTVIERVTGIKGKSNKGEYKITVPQNDLSVVVDDFKIIPAMGLSTWIAFSPSKEGVMIMCDLVLTETDLKP